MPEQITSIVVTAFIAVLVFVIAWLLVELKKLKDAAAEAVDQIVPNEWDWLVERLARTFVRAAYQLFPLSETEKMLEYTQDNIYKELEARGFYVSPKDKEKIRAIIEAACVDFYTQIGKPELLGG